MGFVAVGNATVACESIVDLFHPSVVGGLKGGFVATFLPLRWRREAVAASPM